MKELLGKKLISSPLISFLLLLVILETIFNADPTAAPPLKTTIRYVSLGDSIATGTIYPGKVITTYVTYFHQFLRKQNPNVKVTLTKLAVDGDRTNELYKRLGAGTIGTGDAKLIAAVREADIITLCIGGNNLMQAAKNNSALVGYNFNNINTAVAEQGLHDFQSQWVPIIKKIKNLNPKVKLIVTTTYNPYNETDTKLHNIAESFLTRMDGSGLNNLILNNASKLGYSVANVYRAFEDNYRNNKGEITYFYPTNFLGAFTRNPHPNNKGQTILTELFKQTYISLKD